MEHSSDEFGNEASGVTPIVQFVYPDEEPTPEPAPAPGINAVEKIQNLLAVVLESRPRADFALPLFAALACKFQVPGFETQRKAALKVGRSKSSLSRATLRLNELIKRDAEIRASRLSAHGNPLPTSEKVRTGTHG